MSLKRRIVIAVACVVLLILAVVGYRVAHLIFPNAWLPKTADHFPQQSDSRFVDPHTYDSEWFDAARAGRQGISQALHTESQGERQLYSILKSRLPDEYTVNRSFRTRLRS